MSDRTVTGREVPDVIDWRDRLGRVPRSWDWWIRALSWWPETVALGLGAAIFGAGVWLGAQL